MKLTDEQYKEVANETGIEVALLKTVADVEGKGNGFNKDGSIVILFEGHVFYAELKKRGIDPVKLMPYNQDIIYPKWTKKYYQGGSKEHDRLNRAAKIHIEAARMSASWGLFQVMGFNHLEAGYATVGEMVNAYISGGEQEHLRSFVKLLKAKGWLPFLLKKDWRGFALRYNGKGYEANNYHIALEKAYQKFAVTG